MTTCFSTIWADVSSGIQRISTPVYGMSAISWSGSQQVLSALSLTESLVITKPYQLICRMRRWRCRWRERLQSPNVAVPLNSPIDNCLGWCHFRSTNSTFRSFPYKRRNLLTCSPSFVRWTEPRWLWIIEKTKPWSFSLARSVSYSLLFTFHCWILRVQQRLCSLFAWARWHVKPRKRNRIAIISQPSTITRLSVTRRRTVPAPVRLLTRHQVTIRVN